MVTKALLLLILVVPAYADLSDSGNLSIGGYATITGTMSAAGLTSASSVTATAFFGDGSHLTGLSVTAGANNAFTGNNTHAGSETFNSTATFVFSPSSNTTPTANALYSKFIPKAAIIFTATSSSVTTYGAINITSVTRLGVGNYQLNFASPMSSSIYSCICGGGGSTLVQWCYPDSAPKPTASTFGLITAHLSGGVNVANEATTIPVSVICYDYGSTPQ